MAAQWFYFETISTYTTTVKPKEIAAFKIPSNDRRQLMIGKDDDCMKLDLVFPHYIVYDKLNCI
jgi:hypothetical protein